MTTADGSILGTTKIVDNGPSDLRWDLVVMGDGYQATQMTQYAADVQRFVDTMFRTPPFDVLRPAINVHRVDVASTDSGADDPTACGGSGTTARTYFDATFCGNNIRRLLLVNDDTALDTADDQVPQWNAVLVVVNSTVYGGAGGTVGTFSLASGANQIALHELGHSAFGLADEYEYYRGCGVDTDRNNHPSGEPAEANVTVNTNRATLKWRRFVAASTPVPTTNNADCTQCDPQTSPVPVGTVGLFEGAHYYHCDAFRPEFNCMMRVLGQPFCAVCRERIRAVLAPYLPAGRVLVADFGDGNPPAEVRYWENWGQSTLLNGWHDAGDIQLVGDFRGLGRDQVLFINRGGSGGRVLIADFGDGNPPAEVRYWENWGQSTLLNGWHDVGDLWFAGDFRGLGRDQVLFINRGGSGGRVMVADFSGGVPAQVRYWENWGQSTRLNGWHDVGDIQLIGDFMGLGRDQVLFINQGGSGGRVMVADFSGGVPAQVRYWENWGQSTRLNGWHDAGDLWFAGDFRGLGRDQVLFINRGGSGGRVLIADFGDGNPPAEVRYWENWGQSTRLNGWHDAGDIQLVGDFMGLGRDQVLFINQGGSGGRVLIADFGDGNPPAEVRYWENWGQSTLLGGWHDAGDIQLVGDFRGFGREQVLFVNRST